MFVLIGRREHPSRRGDDQGTNHRQVFESAHYSHRVRYGWRVHSPCVHFHQYTVQEQKVSFKIERFVKQKTEEKNSLDKTIVCPFTVKLA